jgi:ornithine cyclodeaminase
VAIVTPVASHAGRLLVLAAADVEALLPMGDAIEVMGDALRALARGEAHNPLRFVVRPPAGGGLLGLMPAYRDGYGLKEVCVFPSNPALGLDPHQGAVLLHEPEAGVLRAVINASAVTAIRTAAVSAVATRALARPDASTLALLGSGVQARSHLAAMQCVRSIERVRVWSRSAARAEAFVRESQPRTRVPIVRCATAAEALRDADLVVTATAAVEPIVRRDWLAPGVHLNAVGSSIPTSRELDGPTMAAATLIVDSRESALNESGDYLGAAREGAIGPEHIRAELGEVLIGAHPGRGAPDEITIFESLGLAVEDLAAAQALHARAIARGAGTLVPF